MVVGVTQVRLIKCLVMGSAVVVVVVCMVVIVLYTYTYLLSWTRYIRTALPL